MKGDGGNGFAILVVWKNGAKEYLKEGLGTTPARFLNRSRANEQKQFMLVGISDEVQSVNVVAFPRERSKA